MDISNRVDHMDEELQLLKNEIKQVLLEIQEHVLNIQNPFSGGGVGSLGNFATSEPAPAEPVFTEPLIPEPEPELPTPAPAPVATEVSVTTQTETVAPVAAPVAPPVAAPAAAPVAPAADFVPSTPAPTPAGPAYTGPAFVPPPVPPVMPSMPFMPPSGGFGGAGLGGPMPDQGDHDRQRARDLERELDREIDKNRDRERELDRSSDRDRDKDHEPVQDRDRTGDQGERRDRPFDTGFPDDNVHGEGSYDEDDTAASLAGDRVDPSDSRRDFADVVASLEDELGMPGLPPADSARKASGGDKQQSPESDYQDGGSLGPPGMVFSLPGLNIDGKAVDLLTTAGLIQWAYSVLAKVGSENLFSLLELSALTGRIPEETRDILLSVMPIFEMGGLAENVTVKDIIATLAELDGFMGNISPEDTRLLPFLLQEEMDVFPLIRPR